MFSASKWVGLLIVAGALAVTGCNSSPSAPSGGASVGLGNGPSPTAVGPIPGGQGAPPGATDPYIGKPVALQQGRQLFVWFNCYGCHGGHGGGGMAPSLRDNIWLYGDRDDQIYDSIAEGRSKGMPAWGTKIPQKEIWELVAYIKSMRTPAEPDPPIVPANEQAPNPVNNVRLNVGPHQH